MANPEDFATGRLEFLIFSRSCEGETLMPTPLRMQRSSLRDFCCLSWTVVPTAQPRPREASRIQFLDHVQPLSPEEEALVERAASEGSEEAEDESAQLVVLDPDHVRTCPWVLLWPCVGENHLGLLCTHPGVQCYLPSQALCASVRPPTLSSCDKHHDQKHLGRNGFISAASYSSS